MTTVQQAFQQAKQSGGDAYAGGEDVLLALATEPSLARDVLTDLGVTPERIRTVSAECAQARAEEIDCPPLRSGTGCSPSSTRTRPCWAACWTVWGPRRTR
ncbi:Clp protease N-terminal domain-containing protein [Frankia tisae]|uniref:Clp protease N-terminal domain-containing protein n=1 Tax=Frankia tisae TaxID=2950104 RepID=UPI0021C1CCC4|nr:Clp protease N-terminal domain-containing protein [Frankia tisae]